MQIDWLTVVAQIVNFLILVWLLHRFLYRPVLAAMERRERRIADRLAEAERTRQKAEEERSAYHERQAELERRSQAMLSEARQTAEMAKRDMLQAARTEAESRRREWVTQVEAQQQEFLQGLRYRAGEEFFAMARRVLREMADTELESHMTDIFLRHLERLDDDARRRLREAADETGLVTVESCFEFDAGERAELTRGIHEALGSAVRVEFHCEPDRPFGLETRSGSQTVVWTFDDYLDQMEKGVNEVLARRPAVGSAEAR